MSSLRDRLLKRHSVNANSSTAETASLAPSYHTTVSDTQGIPGDLVEPFPAHICPFAETVYFPQPRYALRNEKSYLENYGGPERHAVGDAKVSLSIPRIQYRNNEWALAAGQKKLILTLLVECDKDEVSNLFVEATLLSYGADEASDSARGPWHLDAMNRVKTYRCSTSILMVTALNRIHSSAFDRPCMMSGRFTPTATWSAIPYGSYRTEVEAHFWRPVVIEATAACFGPVVLSLRLGMKPGQYDNGKRFVPTNKVDAFFAERTLYRDISRPILLVDGQDVDLTAGLNLTQLANRT